MTDLCRDCRAPVIWCITETGANMPVDAKPVRKVMVLKINPKNPGGPPLAKFVGQHEAHFASCPAASARRGTGKKAEAAEQAKTAAEAAQAPGDEGTQVG